MSARYRGYLLFGPRWLRVALLRLQRPLCRLRRHEHWKRETTLLALAGGRSLRCPACNRLVLKKQFRDDYGWMRTVRGWVWSRG